jgi:catechol 2,3-dioxygenase-like lactoylglutathione lyase family enzyme
MAESTGVGAAHLRVARPTDDLDAVVRFYRDGLGFAVIGGFKNHAGYDGVMLGRPGADYHLEFTRRAGHPAGPAPSVDHLLVFYLPDRTAWLAAVARLEGCGYVCVSAENPYWDRHGKTFADPDGYRVVLQQTAWPTQGNGGDPPPGE